MVVIKRKNNPARKTKSAIFSYRSPGDFLLRIERKENRLLVMNITIAAVVSSSMKVFAVRFITFKEVSTIKQIPSNVADVFSICGDRSLFSAIADYFDAGSSVNDLSILFSFM